MLFFRLGLLWYSPLNLYKFLMYSQENPISCFMICFLVSGILSFFITRSILGKELGKKWAFCKWIYVITYKLIILYMCYTGFILIAGFFPIVIIMAIVKITQVTKLGNFLSKYRTKTFEAFIYKFRLKSVQFRLFL